jgi:transcriptional regulator with XRE-family HTH domain
MDGNNALDFRFGRDSSIEVANGCPRQNGPENQLQTAGDVVVELGTPASPTVLHRLAAVRRAKGIPRRVLARRLGISVEELRFKEESTDISVSTLCEWASKLGVPVTELVVEPDEALTPTQLAQSQAARLMKVAARLRDRTKRRNIRRLAQTFVEQLTEILPALAGLGQKNHRDLRRPSLRPPAHVLPRLPEDVFKCHGDVGDR